MVAGYMRCAVLLQMFNIGTFPLISVLTIDMECAISFSGQSSGFQAGHVHGNVTHNLPLPLVGSAGTTILEYG